MTALIKSFIQGFDLLFVGFHRTRGFLGMASINRDARYEFLQKISVFFKITPFENIRAEAVKSAENGMFSAYLRDFTQHFRAFARKV